MKQEPQRVIDPKSQIKADRVIAMLRARAVARYGLRNRSGKLEELESVKDPRYGISISYGCQAVRVRLMDGREWVSHIDLPAVFLRAYDIKRFNDTLDAWFGAPDPKGKTL